MKAQIVEKIVELGWSNEYLISSDSRLTISAFKHGVGLCCQTGNVARVYADLLKLQTLFINKNIGAGIIIVPTQKMANIIGTNVANSEKLNRELIIFKSVITIPLVIIGFGQEE